MDDLRSSIISIFYLAFKESRSLEYIHTKQEPIDLAELKANQL